MDDYIVLSNIGEIVRESFSAISKFVLKWIASRELLRLRNVGCVFVDLWHHTLESHIDTLIDIFWHQICYRTFNKEKKNILKLALFLFNHFIVNIECYLVFPLCLLPDFAILPIYCLSFTFAIYFTTPYQQRSKHVYSWLWHEKIREFRWKKCKNCSTNKNSFNKRLFIKMWNVVAILQCESTTGKKSIDYFMRFVSWGHLINIFMYVFASQRQNQIFFCEYENYTHT